ncbi:MAG TPA: hypothetical protein VMT52_07275, partial [Planctomycetota bacterium]|nr:hypothetical protein [Planctomycetota bacterium]
RKTSPASGAWRRPSVSRYALAPGQPSDRTGSVSIRSAHRHASQYPGPVGVRAPSSVALTPLLGAR